ncbi:radical SAM protein [Candidatus Sumerlaeota bacterium]|nr:radical SAM protein [Candidatus Sumerlaeota bacterium]
MKSIEKGNTVLRVHQYLPRTEAEGPGVRACVWVQGCSIHCKGCFMQEAWDPNAGKEYDVEELANDILAQKDIEGLTILGGEPFDQAHAVGLLASIMHVHGLSVMTFTGYKVEELWMKNDTDVNALLNATDLLVDSPFILELESNDRPWVGSSNQRFHFLSSRYIDLKDSLHTIKNKIEVRIDKNGQYKINGMASKKIRDEMFDKLRCPQNNSIPISEPKPRE